MYCIGLDLHAKTFSVAVLDEKGVVQWERTRETTGANLMQMVKGLAGPKVVAVEESTMADWAFRVLSPYAKVIVCDPRENHWIAKDEKITDSSAARKLARLLRMGMVKAVYHSRSVERQTFKELVQAYHDLSQQITRFKNKLKAKFRRRGIPCSGAAVYGVKGRATWRAKLDSESARTQADLLWATLDHFQEQQRFLRREIATLAKQFPQIARFRKVPGVGPIRAATFFAYVDTPDRFRTHGKLWAYCSLGLAQQSSGQSCGPEHLTRGGNRVLKAALKGAALDAIKVGGNPFADKYRRQIEAGTPPEIARVSVARSIANTLWAMWRKDEDYLPDHSHAPATA